MKPLLKVGIVFSAALLFCACAGKSARLPQDGRGSARVGFYRATLEQEGRSAESFKLLLWAGRPDRLHGEVVGPMGRTYLIFDGGGGRMAVTFVRERVSYAGDAGVQVMEKLIGIPISLEQLVGGLLAGEGGGESLRIAREPEDEGLPESLLVEESGRSLRLALKRFKALNGPEAGLGRGEPPPGMDVLPIDMLEPVTYAEETTTASGGQ